MNNATEIVQFKIRDGISGADFINIVEGLEANYHSKQPGFIDTELLCNEESATWTMIQHWESMELMETASEKMFGQEEAQPFVQSLIPDSVNMVMLTQLKKWTV